MSAVPNSGVEYFIRASLDKFAADLRQSEQMAEASARRVQQKTDAIAQQAFKSANLDDLERARFAGTGPAKGAGGGVPALSASGSVLSNIDKITGAMRVAAKGALAVEVAFQAINVAGAAVQVTTAIISGNLAQQQAAAAKVKDVIGGIPIIGNRILQIGQLFHDQIIDRITGESAYVEKLKQATAEQEKQIAKMAEQLKLRQKFVESFEQFAAGLEGKSDTRTDAQKRVDEIAQAERELQTFVESEHAKNPRGGQRTEASLDAEKRAREAIYQMRLAHEKALADEQMKYHEEQSAAGEKQRDEEFAEENAQAQWRQDREAAIEEAAEQTRLKEVEAQREAYTEQQRREQDLNEMMQRHDAERAEAAEAEAQAVASAEGLIAAQANTRGVAMSGAAALMTNFGAGGGDEQARELRKANEILDKIRRGVEDPRPAVTS